jgi:hypothetical protein
MPKLVRTIYTFFKGARGAPDASWRVALRPECAHRDRARSRPTSLGGAGAKVRGSLLADGLAAATPADRAPITDGPSPGARA